MIVRSYSGRSVAEALAKVRADLGEGALIIETRTVREPGLLGARTGYEVVAARDDATCTVPPAAPPAPAREPEVRSWTPDELPGQAAGLAREIPPRADAPVAAAPGIEEELASIRRQLARLATGQGTPVGNLGDATARRLEDVELPGEITAELDEACSKAGGRLAPARRDEFLTLLLARGLPHVRALEWEQCRRLMLVGATGVGKTTTIAKLAGELVLKRRRSVALVTIDTYRVGAQDQLKTYADLLDIPVEVASTPAQLARCLERFSGLDHVLIDTAGRSPADSARVHELKGFCRAAPGISVMLAAAATSGRAEFASVVERFSILPIEHAVVTKLDECVAPGRLYGCLRRHRLPVRLLTTGQEVPEDICAADARELAARVLADVAALAA
ncbi:MAG: flagellar biosynthesis protein FlhF [Planctomycetes bacterium]|nr:flagellar biosynthesis protein FlhF [Planctomycetota bacterium]